MLIYQSKVNFDGKILFGNITHLKEPEIRKMLERGLWGPKFHIPFRSMTYLLLKLEFISETDNCIEFEFQCRINDGPE